MTILKNTLSVSSVRFTVACMGMAAVWLFAPEIVQAAVTFGEIGQNVADNSKGVAKGITMAGYAAGAGMGVWGTVDMYMEYPGREGLQTICQQRLDSPACLLYNGMLTVLPRGRHCKKDFKGISDEH